MELQALGHHLEVAREGDRVMGRTELIVGLWLSFGFSLEANAGGIPCGASPPAPVEDGFVAADDGVRLYYQKAGHGTRTVLLPSRLFTFQSFAWLALDYTLISYDMRNRGRSDFVPEGERLTLEWDVRDLEAVRKHFGIERFVAIGYSYLAKMVVLYALRHPDRVERIVQIGAVPMKFHSDYPANLKNEESLEASVDRDALSRLREMRQKDLHLTEPRRYCEEEWRVVRVRLVGDPVNVARLGESVCDMVNEWPANLARHLHHHYLVSMPRYDVTREDLAGLTVPVLTIHGTKDRNAPYGASREWALSLPSARLITVDGAAHQVWADAPEVFDDIRIFLEGRWPVRAEKVTALDPPSLR